MTYAVQCEWLPANNFLFQVANVWLLLSYFCPPTLNGLIYLRLSLGLAGVFFALWGWLVLCALDTVVWNLLFFIGNFLHLGYILFVRRSKKFSKDMEIVYEQIFEPIKTPRHQFQYLAKEYEIKILSPGEIWVIDGVTQLKTLSVLLTGKLEVRKHGQIVHSIKDFQFVNSSEWIMSQDIPYIFEVTIQAKTECKIMSWDRMKLLDILRKNCYLKAVLDSVVSRDVAHKLFAINRRIQKSGHGLTHSIYSINEIGVETFATEIVTETLNNEETEDMSDDDKMYNVETSLLSNGFDDNERETRL